MSVQEPSGADLARIALRSAQRAAKKAGEGPVARTGQRGSTTVARRDGRDPMAFGEAISRLIAERGWEEPAAAGSVTDRWAEIAGARLAAHVTPVKYDQDSGCLTITADSTAWATQARLGSAELIRRAREVTGRQAIREIRVQQPGTGRRTDDRTPPPAESGMIDSSRSAEPPGPSAPPSAYRQARANLHGRSSSRLVPPGYGKQADGEPHGSSGQEPAADALFRRP